ncbi:MAG: AAA family ATPase [Thermodesulfobacteriota bacterium]
MMNDDDLIHSFATNLQKDGWRITWAKISTVGIGLELEAPGASWPDSTPDSLQQFVTIIREIAIQSDFLMPILIGFPNMSKEATKTIARWQRLQDWHQGNFFLVPCRGKNENKPAFGLKPLLHPQKPDLAGYTPKAYTIERFIKELQEEQDIPQHLVTSLLSHLYQGFKSAKRLTGRKGWISWWDDFFQQNRSGTGQKSDEKTTTSQKTELPEETEKSFNDFGRAKSICIKNFKGIGNSGRLDLDADIVLVSGANGNGKSSFVEALTIALTGYHPHLENDVPQPHLFHYNSDHFSIELKGDQKNLLRVTGQNTNTNKEINFSNRLRIKKRHIEQVEQFADETDPLLLYRMTTFLPDHVDILFDEKVIGEKPKPHDDDPIYEDSPPKARALTEVFVPLPLPIDALRKSLTKAIKDIDEEIAKLGRETSSLQERATNIGSFLGSLINELEQRVNMLLSPLARSPVHFAQPPQDSSPQYPDILNMFLAEQQQFLGNSLGLDIMTWPDTIKNLPRRLEDLLKDKFQDIDYQKLEQEKKELSNKLQIIQEKLAEKREVIEPELTRLLEILRSLGNPEFLAMCEKTLRRRAGLRLNDIATEVELVDSDKAKRFCQVLDELIADETSVLRDKEREVHEKLNEIESRLEHARQHSEQHDNLQQLKNFLENENSKDNLELTDKFVKEYKEKAEREERLRQLRETRNERYPLLAFLDKLGSPPEDFRKIFEEVFNNVLNRFALAEGLNQASIQTNENGGLKIESDDKRDLPCFSLGQRSQMATAWMVTSRELARNCEDILFPHKILILDDLSATFDMTNLLSQAILWRQLAYHPDPQERYQVFIVSHHEEFTDRLLDLLCPPGEGCSMRLLRFTDWAPKPGQGPIIESYKVEPSPSNMEQAVKALENGFNCLKEVL